MTLLDANRPVEGPKQAGTNFASKTTLNPGNDVDQKPFVLSRHEIGGPKRNFVKLLFLRLGSF